MESILKFVEWCKERNLKACNIDNIILYAKETKK